MKISISILVGAVLVFSPIAASANTRSSNDYTTDRFFRCDSITNLWHAIATGKWAFYC